MEWDQEICRATEKLTSAASANDTKNAKGARTVVRSKPTPHEQPEGELTTLSDEAPPRTRHTPPPTYPLLAFNIPTYPPKDTIVVPQTL